MAETLISSLATIIGAITLMAPIIFILLQSRRRKGRSSGVAAVSRTWPGVLLMAIGFVGMGVVLWIPLPVEIPDTVRLFLTIIGALAYFPGVSLYLWGLAVLRSQFSVSGVLGAELYQEHKLITTGPFAVIRHPMYVGVLLAAIGAFLIFKTWAMAIFLPMSLVVLARAGREEKLLEQEFGEEWKLYVSKVPKWFPKF